MAVYAEHTPIFLIKKFAAVIFLLLGLLITATGFANQSTSLAVIGALMLSIGVLLLVLKVVRRNRGR
ncbi:hypothetical protein [Bradyrhizobium sp. LHD-71]|uniref:hypothetical protein n=1 Tax=Bradyrhizobium sp. LHD-71 TaxID=3072141 RepID=UPI00280EDA66|nr:hypothetical protein [Bradyrhizobium sp. LHD-71]MDQ8732607.1 hypothetical protein [Bradyrhizobium sp. LHD-71]